MSKDTAVAVREETALTPAQERTARIRQSLVTRLPDLLPKGADPNRFVAMTMQAVAKSPDLQEADPTSIIMAALEAAQVGLEPTGAMGGAHLVAFNVNVAKKGQPAKYEKRAQLIYDYRGLQHLIREGGGGEVKAVAVYEGDHFKAVEGTGGAHIEHEPAYETTDPDRLRFVYAYPLDDPAKFEVMTKAQVDGIRARSKGANNGPWVTDYVQQARKTVIKRLSNYLELKPSVRALLDDDAEREFGDAVAPAEIRVSRTADVKAQLQAKLLAPGAQDAPGPDSPTVGGHDAAPAVSASQQPDTATTEPEKVQAEELCGATSDPNLGDVEWCSLKPGHAFPDGKLSAHQSSTGTKFPRKADSK